MKFNSEDTQIITKENPSDEKQNLEPKLLSENHSRDKMNVGNPALKVSVCSIDFNQTHSMQV